MKHVAFFGDGEKTFALTIPLIQELERTTGHGVGAIFRRVQAQDFGIQEITEVIRLGLIGRDLQRRLCGLRRHRALRRRRAGQYLR